MGKGKFVAVRQRSGLRREIVIDCDRFGDRDEAGGTKPGQFPEKFAQLFLEEVFKDASVRDEDGAGSGIILQPVEDVAPVKKEPFRAGMVGLTFFNLAGIEIDSVKFAYLAHFPAEPFQHLPVARSDLDEAGAPAGERQRRRDFARDPRVVPEKKCLKTVRKTFKEFHRGGG